MQVCSNGTKVQVCSNGTKVQVCSNGTKVQVCSNGTKVLVEFKDGCGTNTQDVAVASAQYESLTYLLTYFFFSYACHEL